jgi:hypothetical protein
MEQILPGVRHWSAIHPNTGMPAHSYAIGATLVDPILPEAGIDALTGPVEQIVLTNRHHWRSSGELVERFGCRVRCHEAGLHEFSDGRRVEGFRGGDRLADQIEAIALGAICDEETVLHVAAGEGALAIADAAVRWHDDDELAFVPDSLLGDDPEAVKAALRERLAGLLELDFDSLLLAHGQPIIGGGKDRLRRFVG